VAIAAWKRYIKFKFKKDSVLIEGRVKKKRKETK